jgi:hypothetical protein
MNIIKKWFKGYKNMVYILDSIISLNESYNERLTEIEKVLPKKEIFD